MKKIGKLVLSVLLTILLIPNSIVGVSADSIESQLSDDFMTLYQLKKERNPEYTLEEFIQEPYLDFFDPNAIWQPSDDYNNYEGVFVGRDFRGIELFENLENLSFMFVGPLENYNLEPLKNMNQTDIFLTVGYEPRMLSDHVNFKNRQHAYIYNEAFETGIVEALNLLGETIKPGVFQNLHLGYGMSHLPRIYNYQWTGNFMAKGMRIDTMEQNGSGNYLIIDYTIRYDEQLDEYKMDFEFENPFSGVTQTGNTFEPVDYFGDFNPYLQEGFSQIYVVDKDQNKHMFAQDWNLTPIPAVNRIGGTFDIEGDIASGYYVNNTPMGDSVHYLLPSQILDISTTKSFDVNLDTVEFYRHLSLFAELPVKVDFDINPDSLGIDVSKFDGSDTRQWVKNNESLVEPVVELNNNDYIFGGWFTSKDYTPETKWDFAQDKVVYDSYYHDWQNEDYKEPTRTAETLYAQWIPKSEFATVTFDSQAGTAVPAKTVRKGTPVEQPANPHRENYNFEGWYTTKAFDTEWNFDTVITEDMMLYAKWSKQTEIYTVTFDSVGGSEVALQKITEGNKAEKPEVPTQAGYDFIDWYTTPTYETAWNFDTVVTEDMTLYAKWSKQTEVYTVTFDSVGGSDVETQSVKAGEKALEPVAPVRSGYEFEGWFVTPSYDLAWNFQQTVNEDLTLYARWKTKDIIDPVEPEEETKVPSEPETNEDKELPNTGISNVAIYTGVAILIVGVGIVLKLKFEE